MTMYEPRRQTFSTTSLALIALGLAWLSFPLLFPVGLVVWGFCLFQLQSRYSRLLGLTVLLSPYVLVPVFAMLTAAFTYLGGSPELRQRGLLGQRGNLDPQLRCYSVGIGPAPPLHSCFSVLPHNATVGFLSALAGPPKDSYRGEYPTMAQAEAQLKAMGIRVAVADLTRSFRWDGRELHAPDRAVGQLMEGAPGFPPPAAGDKVDVALYGNQCLLIGYEQPPQERNVALVDMVGGELFARYKGEQGAAH
jgi:hypothetical protein